MISFSKYSYLKLERDPNSTSNQDATYGVTAKVALKGGRASDELCVE